MTRNEPLAIVGFGGVFPSSPTLSHFWSHIVSAHDTARETPDQRWTLAPDRAFDPNSPAPDRVYSRRACLVDDPGLIVGGAIDGLAIEPDFAQKLDVMVQLALRAGRDAWFDAHMDGVDRSRIGVILGNIALPTESSSLMADWVLGRRFDRDLFATSTSAPAPINRFVIGLPAGILAKALGLGGGHYTIDAACASSLFALELAVEELRSGRADAMLAGGVSRPDCLYTQMGFAQLTALSASGRCCPFDRKGDGLVIGEGAGVFVLKRLGDALAHEDTIHALVRGIGTSNDVDGNLLAPSQEGQLRAMHKAYGQAGWDPRTLDLIECHATGTQVGDGVEFSSLRALWGNDDFEPGQCTIGSVKSNVGHLLTGAGAAGLAKVLLAMRHRVLPATANFETAGDSIDLDGSPFVVRSESTEWNSKGPRRAAVSGFGFGGTNAHVLLEEWTPATKTSVAVPTLPIDDEVVLVGMSATVGAWNGLEAFQHRVLGGGPEVSPAVKNGYWGLPDPPQGYFIDELEVPIGEFRIPPKEIEEMLPQQLLMLQVSKRALADAVTDTIDRLRTGVFIGIGLDLNTTNYHLRWVLHDRACVRREQFGGDDEQFDAWLHEQSNLLSPALNANRVMGNLGGLVASRVAREFCMGGPSYVVSSEEGSGFSALAGAVRGLQRAQIDCALVGAIDLCGDPRQTIASDAQKPMSRTGSVRPFDKAADGTLPGEGAVALVLKRRRDAERDGDRIYATVCGLGSATGGTSESIVPTEQAYLRALASAYQDAGVDPASVGFVETHGSGHAPEDRVEAHALSAWFHGVGTTVLGSAKADVGHTGAAAALVSIAKASLALHHRTLPPMRGINHPRQVLQDFALPRGAQYWLHDGDGAPRRAGVSSMSSTGHVGHVVLEAVDTAATSAHPLGPLPEALFVLEEGDRGGLLAGLQQLAALASDPAIDRVAQRWWQLHGSDATAALGLALVARDPEELRRLIGEATSHLRDGAPLHSRRIFFSREPLGPQAEVAFVYPGSGSQYAGMGRELSANWPAILRAQEQEFVHLHSQLVPQLIWNDQGRRPDTQQLILAQVALGTVVSDLVRSFGVEPKAIIGYSLGETTGMFSLRVWHDRDEMLRRVQASDLFTSELCGPCDAAKRTWGLDPADAVEWILGVVDRPAAVVREALAGVGRAYLLIVNTPDECVIGGEAAAVRNVVSRLASSFHELHGVTTVHCEVAKAVETRYYELHILETVAAEGIRFYSGARGESFPVSQQRAAQSILDNAIDGVDWPKTIQQAYSDGARIFLEMGPGASCTRMIEKILEGRRFVARAVCAQGQDGVSSILRTLGALVAERIPVDLGSLYFSSEPSNNSGACITVPVGRDHMARATRPTAVRAPTAPRPVPPSKGSPLPRASVAPSQPRPMRSAALTEHSTAARIIATSEASARAHDAYLRLSTRVATLVTDQLRAGPDLLHVPVPRTPPEHVELDRGMCLEFAMGSIAKVLGPEFAAIDGHPTRVRLPDEPLMLVDRILRIEGEPLSLTTGKVVTEHDVLEGAWYLDNGRIPTCIAVEAGQADLFLSGYLGIDFMTKGLACYRLLDAVVTFHDELPGVGDVIHYDIDILEFFRQGDTWLFRFQFDATVNGVKLMTMRDGCAGFFSQQELDAGKGIVRSRLQDQEQSQRQELPADWRPLVPMSKCSLDAQQVEALRQGDLATAFGRLFADLPLRRPLTIPGGRMQLVHRVDEIDPHGGRYGIGLIRAQADIHPDDWFLTCHFVDDKVMPGTLMYECCLHTLRIYLLRMGWVTESDQVVAQPITGIGSRLKCRGQVLDTTKLVTYEVSIKQLGYGPEPFAIVDALMYADGKPIVEISDLSLRLSGASRGPIEAMWAARTALAPHTPVPFRPALYDYDRILAFSNGKPSEAFGEPYRVFDQQRKIARLPRPPFQFLDRIVEVQGQPFVMQAGAKCVAQVEITPDQWYFASNRQAEIPFAVLLEMALQPCGWLAAYVGSALQSSADTKFRNLGGDAVQRRSVLPEQDVLTNHVEMTGVSSSAGMLIQHYSFDLRSERFGSVYSGTTYFGFFSNEALANQLGIRDAELYQPGPAERLRATQFPVPTAAPFPDDVMRMVSDVDLYVSDGGPHELGYIEGSIAVRPDFWFFDAHFFEDPVWPGSLGLEAFLQLMKVVAHERWRLGPTARFATMPTGARHKWLYRGQVLPACDRVTVKVVIQSIDDANHRIVADGFLCVDGRTIYQMIDFALETRP